MSDEKCGVEGKVERDIAPGLSMADAAALSDIFKLNVVCFEDLFDRLSLNELLTLRATCKRIKQVVDYYIRINFPAVKIGWGKVNIRDDFEKLLNLGVNDIRMIKDIDFRMADSIQPEMLVDIKDVLAQVESVTIDGPRVNGEFYDVFLKFCKSLKLLYLNRVEWDIIAGTGIEWLLRQYPTLEHIVLDDRGFGGPAEGDTIIALKTFFELNPNIRIFSTSLHYLFDNRRWIIGSNIKFDRLDLEVYKFSKYGMRHICGLLNELHDQGFYKRLHFYGNRIYSEEDTESIFSLHALEKLHLAYGQIDYSIPPLTGLKELSFGCDEDIKNANAWASNLIRVERIRVEAASLTDIMPFISHSKNVREIKIDYLEGDNHFEDGIVDLRPLNREREQLAGAKKIIIYVHEWIYLKTKWTQMGTIFPLIELKRAQSMEKCFEFD